MGLLNDVKIVDELDDNYIDWGLKSINADKVWHLTKGEGVKIAIMDTGINVNHKDLKHNIKKVVNYRNDEGVDDLWGHGTMIAGLIAGKRTGVAPNAELYISKVLGENGVGSIANISNGMLLATSLNVDILCLSLGMKRKLPQAIVNRINNAVKKNIIIVCATGNEGLHILRNPASDSNVVAVGGVNKKLEISNFSNYGTGLDVVAPSVDILSTFKDNNYAKMTGTSMSAPLVAGGIALIISYYRKMGKEVTLEDIREIMKASLDNKGSKDKYGYGVMDLEKIFNYINKDS